MLWVAQNVAESPIRALPGARIQVLVRPQFAPVLKHWGSLSRPYGTAFCPSIPVPSTEVLGYCQLSLRDSRRLKPAPLRRTAD